MKYIVTFFWSFFISQVTFYLGASLTSSTYSFVGASAISVVLTLSVIAVAKILPPIKHENTHK